MPPGISTWQFNFRFDLDHDLSSRDSMDLLTKSGLKWEDHKVKGIDPLEFGEMMHSSGMVLNPEIRWLSFHSSYDFCYLLKIVRNRSLPQTEAEYFRLLRIFFPKFYDIKDMMLSCENLKGGLDQLGNDLSIIRVGTAHQAGSDSHLTAMTFFRLRDEFFHSKMGDGTFEGEHCGSLYGLNRYSMDWRAIRSEEADDEGTDVDELMAEEEDTYLGSCDRHA
jgi:CCR4-NOT transcription complex subunit 7/8